MGNIEVDKEGNKDERSVILVQESFFLPAGSRLHSGAGFQPAKTFLDSYISKNKNGRHKEYVCRF